VPRQSRPTRPCERRGSGTLLVWSREGKGKGEAAAWEEREAPPGKRGRGRRHGREGGVAGEEMSWFVSIVRDNVHEIF